jgi:hypothetical protein
LIALFYRKYGFAALGDSDLHFYLPLATIQAVIGAG